MLRPAAAACLAVVLAGPVSAGPAQTVAPVLEALRMPELLEVMHEEGMSYGADLEADLFPGRGGAAWAATVGGIYALDRMEGMIGAGLASTLDPAEAEAIVAFFKSPAGQRIVELELAARRAMLDDAVEEAAGEAWQALEAEGGARWQLLIEFAEVNDLVESNVAGALTANYAFYGGLVEGKAYGFDMSEEQILADVWGQEDAVREDTVNWVYSFTALAYQPLSDAELGAYVDFARTDAGQAVNAALFEAFNAMFATISRDLGRGAARYLAGQDI
jgi:hypothetical protein